MPHRWVTVARHAARIEEKDGMRPNSAEELRAEADHLILEKKPQEAGVYLDHAARLFLASGQTLPAVAAMKLKWRTMGPDRRQEEEFIASLGRSKGPKGSFGHFLGVLPPSARKLWLRHLEYVTHPEGALVKRCGEAEKALYFVVGGALWESDGRREPRRSERQPKPGRFLIEGDHFGKIYPLSQTLRSRSHVETFRRSELLRISRRAVIRLCNRFEEVEYAIIELCGVRTAGLQTQRADLTPAVRHGDRYPMAASVKVEVETGDGRSPIIFSGLTYDISVGGLCFIPTGDKSYNCMSLLAVKHGSRKKVRVVLNTHTLSMAIGGEIVRIHRIREKNSLTPAIGIRFEGLAPALRGVFFAFLHQLREISRSTRFQ